MTRASLSVAISLDVKRNSSITSSVCSPSSGGRANIWFAVRDRLVDQTDAEVEGCHARSQLFLMLNSTGIRRFTAGRVATTVLVGLLASSCVSSNQTSLEPRVTIWCALGSRPQ